MDIEIVQYSKELDLILNAMQSLRRVRSTGSFSVDAIALKSGLDQQLTNSLIQYLYPKFIDKSRPITSGGAFYVSPKSEITAFLASGGFSSQAKAFMQKEAEAQVHLNFIERATRASEESAIAARAANEISRDANATAEKALKKSANANRIAWIAVLATVIIEFIKFLIEKK